MSCKNEHILLIQNVPPGTEYQYLLNIRDGKCENIRRWDVCLYFVQPVAVISPLALSHTFFFPVWFLFFFSSYSLFWIPSGLATILCLFSVSAWLTDSCGVRLRVQSLRTVMDGEVKHGNNWDFFLSHCGTFHNWDVEHWCGNQPLLRGQGDVFPFFCLLTSRHCRRMWQTLVSKHLKPTPESDSNIWPWKWSWILIFTKSKTAIFDLSWSSWLGPFESAEPCEGNNSFT